MTGNPDSEDASERVAQRLAAELAGLLAQRVNDRVRWAVRTGWGSVAPLGIGSLIAWLIVAHDLWENPATVRPPELARLFNIGTVLTLCLTTAVSYVVLLARTAAAAWLLIRPYGLRRTAIAPIPAAGSMKHRGRMGPASRIGVSCRSTGAEPQRPCSPVPGSPPVQCGSPG